MITDGLYLNIGALDIRPTVPIEIVQIALYASGRQEEITLEIDAASEIVLQARMIAEWQAEYMG